MGYGFMAHFDCTWLLVRANIMNEEEKKNIIKKERMANETNTNEKKWEERKKERNKETKTQ